MEKAKQAVTFDEEDYACLLVAIRNNERPTVKLLLKFGADPNHESYGVTPLNMAAAQNSYTEIAKLLLEHGALINQPNVYGSTPLHSAAMASNSIRMVEFLLAQGADPTARNEDGKLPLDVAYEKEVRALLEQHTASCPAP